MRIIKSKLYFFSFFFFFTRTEELEFNKLLPLLQKHNNFRDINQEISFDINLDTEHPIYDLIPLSIKNIRNLKKITITGTVSDYNGIWSYLDNKNWKKSGCTLDKIFQNVKSVFEDNNVEELIIPSFPVDSIDISEILNHFPKLSRVVIGSFAGDKKERKRYFDSLVKQFLKTNIRDLIIKTSDWKQKEELGKAFFVVAQKNVNFSDCFLSYINSYIKKTYILFFKK